MVWYISQGMTALIGWGGTADFTDDWVYDQAADTYAFDAEMAEKLRSTNPEAFRNPPSRLGFLITNYELVLFAPDSPYYYHRECV